MIPAVFFSQSLPLTNQAARVCKNGDLMAAKDLIGQATSDASEKHAPYTWFVKGYIYKEIYVKIDKQNQNSRNREEAVVAIKKSMSLDREKEHLENNNKALKFLAVSYFNDALKLTKSTDISTLENAQAFYKKFEDLNSICDTSGSLDSYKLDFYKHLGKAYEIKYSIKKDNQEYIDQSIRYYSLALQIDPEDYESNYNTAINYYNQGVFRISKINYNTEIFQLLVIQDECIKLFKQSLPYMLKSHQQTPKRKETLKGLMAIYKALNDDDKSDEYKKTLNDLIDSGYYKR